MLRIVTQEQGKVFTLSLHGRLADEWVELLERHSQSIMDAAPWAEVIVLLADVSFIDAEGERLLERLWRRGTRLEASGCMNRHVVERIRGADKAARTPRRPVRPASAPKEPVMRVAVPGRQQPITPRSKR